MKNEHYSYLALGDSYTIGESVDPGLPYPVQIGARNRGRAPMRAQLDEFRISRIARYTADFTPSRTAFKLDPNTSALLHFDGDLTGHGTTPDGHTYRVDATAGFAAFAQ